MDVHYWADFQVSKFFPVGSRPDSDTAPISDNQHSSLRIEVEIAAITWMLQSLDELSFFPNSDTSVVAAADQVIVWSAREKFDLVHSIDMFDSVEQFLLPKIPNLAGLVNTSTCNEIFVYIDRKNIAAVIIFLK